MKKIIVTGGAGYIGAHTVIELSKAGYKPVIIDNLSNSDIINIKGIELILNQNISWYKADCTERNQLEDIFKNEKDISGVIHFAAYKSVEESVHHPEKYFKNNVGSLENMLNVMRKFSVQNIIFSSSCTVYGNPDNLPVTESDPFKEPTSPYGETKQICENILKSDTLHSVSLRYFNPIGSHRSCNIGDGAKDKPSNLIPILTEVAIGKRDKITVYGNDYDTNDGTCVRDYIHVSDLAEAHVNALNFLLKKSGKHIFNVGTGKGVSVLEAIKIFEKANKLKINHQIGPRRSGDAVAIYSDNKKIKRHLNWVPKRSLSQAMIDAWNWEKKKLNLL